MPRMVDHSVQKRVAKQQKVPPAQKALGMNDIVSLKGYLGPSIVAPPPMADSVAFLPDMLFYST